MKTNDATRATAEVVPAALNMALASLDQVEHMIHAAWMAARSLEGNEAPPGAALQAVIHSAGEWLQEVRGALRKAGAA